MNRKQILANRKVHNPEANDINGFSFEKVKLPSLEVTLSSDKDLMVKYGDDNQYPFFIMDVYQKCPIHQSIINSKNNYLGGLRKKDGSELEIEMNNQDMLHEFMHKVKLSYLMFNFFAVEVIFNNLNEPIQFVFIEPHKIRTNQLKSKFWFKEDGWKKSGGDIIIYDRYYPNMNHDSKSKVFFFDGYFPSPNVYPTVEYCSSIISILTDIAIRDFNINNIKNHFSASSMITFFNGESVTKDQKIETKRQFKNQFTGEDGSKLFLNWTRDDGKAPEIKNISSGDWDKAYDLISKKVEKDIFIGSQFNSILLNDKQVGSLGNPQELKTAYEIFKCNYIDQKRMELMSAFRQLFMNSPVPISDFEFFDYPLFNDEISETVKTQILTIDELRKLAGFAALPDGKGNRLINDTSEAIQPQNEPENDQRIEPTQDEYDLMFQELNAAGIGVSKLDFEEVNEDKFSFADDEAVEYLTMYDYRKREDVPGGEIISTSRNFCRRMVDLDRYFSMEDMQKISERFGYNVFEHTGGWYRKPGTSNSVNHCRHEWKQVRLKRKVNE